MKKMRKLLAFGLMVFSTQVIAKEIQLPTECQNNGWVGIIVTKNSNSLLFCILPNGKYYGFEKLKQSSSYAHLLKLYSQQSPSIKQIEKAEDELIKKGYYTFVKSQSINRLGEVF